MTNFSSIFETKMTNILVLATEMWELLLFFVLHHNKRNVLGILNFLCNNFESKKQIKK